MILKIKEKKKPYNLPLHLRIITGGLQGEYLRTNPEYLQLMIITQKSNPG
jgi:hypothetical protein